MIIDATNLILGRLAAKVAKQALNGEKNISVINCEKAVITGNKKNVLSNYAKKYEFGQVNQGPYFPKKPEMVVRRTIRGMLPRKKPRGRVAFENIKCYVGIPKDIKAGDAKTIQEASLERLRKAQHVTVEELCNEVGYKTAMVKK